ncbi:Ankyrin repeat domain-containing protein 50 [Hondaea fermentalgiana]|uniref:Ankyrin repeat domain-containing protein 50 n=1 Tax=Hondaea fermentalgiana TaxID=2315210 RepID=A0A2R5GKT8_9STRA|nr:Ankyrin repeat domain-containing protein 50 [Hondaea fermentalgiana]|eukprot:GBG31497.1 Ankyrin repeat domain-containing protein 50 [Hondaea fermentalgiana]
MKAPQSPKDPNFKRKRTVRRTADAGSASAAVGTKQQVLRCPRCAKEGFADVRALGKHAITCKAKGDPGSPKRGGAAGRAPLGNDRMAKLMQIKRMQKQHEDNERTKEEQERIEREMQLIIKMERAREERDEALRKKRAAEEEERAKREAADAKERAEKAALEEQVRQRAQELMADSDSDSDQEAASDEAAANRRKRLAEKLAQKKKQSQTLTEAPSPDSAKAPADPGLETDGADDEPANAALPASVHAHKDDSDWLESSYEGYTAAHMAAFYNDLTHLTKVAELGGDLVTADPEGQTPLHICALYHHNECFELLVGKLVDTSQGLDALDFEGRSALMYAASVGNFAAIAVLADAAPELIEKADFNGDTALHFAVYYGFQDIVEFLLQLGADPDGPPNCENKSPATMCTELETLELLISNGADYYGIDNNGRSILFSACASGYEDVAKFLLQVDHNNNNNDTKTLKGVAEHETEDGEIQDPDESQRLLNFADFRGDTPLHAASCNGHASCVKLLLQFGANVSIQNHAGFQAATLAHCNEHQACIDTFAERNIEPQDMSQFELGHQDGVGPVGGQGVENLNAPEHWQTYTDPDSGCEYFHNPYTGETTWDSPFS